MSEDLVCPPARMYYISMAQPKIPPLSIRPGDARLVLSEAFAAAHELSRYAAMLELIDRGLAAGIKTAPAAPAKR